jgi:hypothetical protein
VSKATEMMARNAPVPYLSATHLESLVLKMRANSSKLSSDEYEAIIDVIQRQATAQRQWDHIYSTRVPGETDRVLALVGTLARLLGRWA